MDEIIQYQIKPLELFTYTFRLLSLISIVLCIYFFDINPLFFSIVIFIAFVIILLSRTSKITLTDKYLLIEHSNLLSFMSKIIKVSLTDIDEIGFNKEFKPIARYLLPDFYLYPTNNNEIILRLKNRTEISQTQIGTKRQFIELLKRLSEIIEKQNKTRR